MAQLQPPPSNQILNPRQERSQMKVLKMILGKSLECACVGSRITLPGFRIQLHHF